MIGRVDHIAIGVEDLEERVAFFTTVLGMKEGRWGTHNSTGGRIAFVADPHSGLKFELVETPDRKLGLLQLAYRVDDVPDALTKLASVGLTHVGGPLRLEAGKFETGVLRDRTGVDIQLIKYDSDSPDIEYG